MIAGARGGAVRPVKLGGLALSLAAAAAGANGPAGVPAASVTIPLGAPRSAPPGVASVTVGVPPASMPVVLSAPVAAPSRPAMESTMGPPLEQLTALDTPVEDCSVTSPFGWRMHPILHRRRFHQGVDFGAPDGTPVHASADGVVEEIGQRGHYGLYLRIRHSGTVQTAYAHLQGFSAGLAIGSTVHRGEVVARVGHTGWATGPHLYYEVIVDGRRVDPRQPGLQVLLQAREAQASRPPQMTGGMP